MGTKVGENARERGPDLGKLYSSGWRFEKGYIYNNVRCAAVSSYTPRRVFVRRRVRAAMSTTRLMAVDASFPDDPVSDYDDAPNTGSLNMIAPHSNSVFGSPAPPPSSSATASASAPAAPDVKIDHRKKRRNRTTQSCLSCHQNKRKVCVLSRAVWFA